MKCIINTYTTLENSLSLVVANIWYILLAQIPQKNIPIAHPPFKEVRSEIELTESIALPPTLLARDLRWVTIRNHGRMKQSSPTRTPNLQQPLSSLGTPNKTRAQQHLSAFLQTIESAVGATVPRTCLGYNGLVRRSQRWQRLLPVRCPGAWWLFRCVHGLV